MKTLGLHVGLKATAEAYRHFLVTASSDHSPTTAAPLAMSRTSHIPNMANMLVSVFPHLC